MSLVNLLLGKPLATEEDRAEKIGPAAGAPIFGLDALGSAAYGPEAALTILIPLGLAGAHYIVPISACIIALLAIVYFSYRQTIEAYPTGGGSYTVVSQNLGPFAGLLAASALMVDYVLVVAVGISAGIGALASALLNWQPYTLELCLAVLAMISIVNLRGVRDAGAAFLFPTYLYLACLFSVIALGVGLGAAATATTTAVIIVSKFSEGAWITLLIILTLMLLMGGVRAHYRRADREIAYRSELSTDNLRPPLVVVPIEGWNKVSEKALRFALTLSPDVFAAYVDSGEEETNLFQMWRPCVEDPLRRAGLSVPKLVALRSPYCFVVTPILTKPANF